MSALRLHDDPNPCRNRNLMGRWPFTVILTDGLGAHEHTGVAIAANEQAARDKINTEIAKRTAGAGPEGWECCKAVVVLGEPE